MSRSMSRSSSEGTWSVDPNEDIESSSFRFGQLPPARGAVAAAWARRDRFRDEDECSSSDDGGEAHYEVEDHDQYTAYSQDAKPAAAPQYSTKAPERKESFSQRMLSRFLNSDRNKLRQPDMGDEEVMNDNRTHTSNEMSFVTKSQVSVDTHSVASTTDSTFQQVLKRGATYVSSRGQWSENLYPRPSELAEYFKEQHPPADLADFRQDSKFSLMDASLVSKGTAESMISKVTFDGTVGDETGSYLSRDTYASRDTSTRDGASRDASRDGASRDASRGVTRGAFRSSNILDAQIQEKMRIGSRLSRPPRGTHRLGELNDDSTSSRERAERQADRQRLRSQHYHPRSSHTLRSSITSHDGTGSYIDGNNSFESGPPDVQAQNPNIAREEAERLAQQAAEPPHARLLNLPGRNRYLRSERPGAVPMQGRPYNSGPLRSMQSELAYPTFMIAANQRLGPPELVAVTSIEIMPQPLTNPRAIQGADVLYPKKVTPTTTWRERPVPAMVCLGMFCCAGFILLVVGVSVVVASRHETPLTSATPTATPTGVGDLLLKDLMSISDSDALLNPESPQHRAGYWLTQMDKLNQDFDLNQLLQRYALVVVYHALTENGANVALNGWLDAGRHECEWGTAIVCGSGSSGLSAKKVVALDLSRLELKGTIPDEIRFLDRLESLQMNNNAIRGTIPPVLGLFSNLQQLDLERNAFTGEIPSVIGGMTSLTHIDLSHNYLNNSLDDGFFKLVALRYVDLSYNRLSGLFTRFANLTFLSTLDVRMNKFSGTFPAHMDQLSELAVLNIDYNEISGTFPPNYAFVGKRIELTASNNLLTGTIPSEAPSELQKEATDKFLAGEWILKKLDIGGNIFSGLVPRLLEVLPNLKHVDIKNNMFVGPAPGFSRSQLDYLSVASNLLTGTMPATVGDSLKHMDYSRNRMSGSLPSELGSLTQLEYLALGNNPFLNGTLATELGELRNVQYIDISNCSLTGTLPTSLQKLSKLVNLTLAGNGLTGPIPPDFQNLSSLKHLALNNNSLSSEIPTTLGKLVDLESVDLSGNNLVGHIPDELTNLGRLVKLFVDHNLLTGNVPVGFCNMLGSPYTNFKDLLIDCEVSCPCCSSHNFGGIDCGSVYVQRGVWHGLF